jgi:hypothetical protein
MPPSDAGRQKALNEVLIPSLHTFIGFTLLFVAFAQNPLITVELNKVARPAVVGMLQSAAAASSVLAAAPIGRASDVYGRKLPYLGLLIFAAGLNLAFSVVEPNLVSLGVGLVGFSIAQQCEDISKSAIADVVPAAAVQSWMQLFYGAFGLAIWGAPRAGKAISAAHGFQGVTAASAGLLLFSTLTCVFAMPGGKVAKPAGETTEAKGGSAGGGGSNLWAVMRKILQNPDMILLLLMRGFHASGAHLALATMGLFIKDGLKIDPSLLSELFSWIGLIFLVCMMIQPILFKLVPMTVRALRGV